MLPPWSTFPSRRCAHPTAPHRSASAGPEWRGGRHPAESDEGLLQVSVTHPSSALTIVSTFGEIDLLTVNGWRSTLAAAVSALRSPALHRGQPAGVRGPTTPEPRLVADMSSVTFLGARGLDVLVELAALGRQANVELWVVPGNRRVSRILHLSGLDSLLTIVSDMASISGVGTW